MKAVARQLHDDLHGKLVKAATTPVPQIPGLSAEPATDAE